MKIFYALINLNLFQDNPKNITSLLCLSRKIHSKIYQNFLAEEDLYQLTTEQTFLFLSPYLKYPQAISPQSFLQKIITGITHVTDFSPTYGMGTNIFLAKTALDFFPQTISTPNSPSSLILNEQTFKRLLWSHRPLSDFWGITPEITNTLAQNNIICLGDLARLALKNQNFFYQTFDPATATLLINHAFGQTPLTLSNFKKYVQKPTKFSQTKTFNPPAPPHLARLEITKLAQSLSQTLIQQKLKISQITLTLTYANHTTSSFFAQPLNHQNRPCHSYSPQTLIQTTLKLYDQNLHPTQKIQTLTLVFSNVRN